MKRKRSSEEAQRSAEAQKKIEASEKDSVPSFSSFDLDSRILQGIAKLKFTTPTPVQEQAIQIAIDGRNILGIHQTHRIFANELARARTGSGKTAAYLIPILQKLLVRSKNKPSTDALIIVPTRELADQVEKVIKGLCAYCAKEIKTVNLAQKTSDTVQKTFLADVPDIVIATPARAAVHTKNKNLDISALSVLVIDEADLVLSYGNEKDVRYLAEQVPSGVQCLLMSATLSDDIETLKGLVCADPVIIEPTEDEDDQRLTQYIVRCAEDEKFLLLYVIFKLQLIKGKSIIFTGDIDRCYRIKLYLEQFAIRSCVLNSELPVNSRIHIVEEFNKNVYDIIIASDETEVIGSEELSANGNGTSKKSKKNKKDKNYGVSRGIDFQAVSFVINFDLPSSATSYLHRIGRTARANKSGTAISFVIPRNQHGKHRPTSIDSTAKDEEVLAEIEESQKALGRELQPYLFDPAAVNPFRYRTSDALRAVTGVAVRDARAKELRRQLLTSDKLKQHFAEHPEDAAALRMDRELRTARVQGHLKYVPGYLIHNAAGTKAKEGDDGFVSMGIGGGQGRRARARMGIGLKGKAKAKANGRRVDVLKSFKARR